MGIGTYIFTFYLTGAVILAIYFFWQMITELDKYDWRFNKSDIWTSFVLATLLWFLILPLLRSDIKNLLKKSEFNLADRAREFNELWNNPPPCSSVIRYSQHDYNEKILGVFLFDSDDMEDAIIDKIEENSRLGNEQEGAILNWLQQRDSSSKEPSNVPEAWHRIQYVVDDLLRHGQGDIFCIACDKAISHSDLVKNDDYNLSGWNYNRLICNAGHPLLEIQRIHILKSASA